MRLASPRLWDIFFMGQNTIPEARHSLVSTGTGKRAIGEQEEGWGRTPRAVARLPWEKKKKFWVQRDTLRASCIDELAMPLRILKERGTDEATGTPWRRSFGCLVLWGIAGGEYMGDTPAQRNASRLAEQGRCAAVWSVVFLWVCGLGGGLAVHAEYSEYVS